MCYRKNNFKKTLDNKTLDMYNKAEVIDVTYAEVYKEFLSSTKIDKTLISDFRPCCHPYFPIEIDNAILVYLQDKSIIVYVNK